jgi:hypothetical protein
VKTGAGTVQAEPHRNQESILSGPSREFFRWGAISCILVAFSIFLAIVAYMIWPYIAGVDPPSVILQKLHQDRLGTLMALDLPMLLIMMLNIIPIIATYHALRIVHGPAALTSLLLGLIAIVLVIPTRPLVELVNLSEMFVRASSDSEREVYLAATQTYLGLFSGTAWCVQTVLFALWGVINGTLMLKSQVFGRLKGWIGIILSLFALPFWVPGVGVIFLFVNTIGTIVWYPMVAISFLRLSRSDYVSRAIE